MVAGSLQTGQVPVAGSQLTRGFFVNNKNYQGQPLQRKHGQLSRQTDSLAYCIMFIQLSLKVKFYLEDQKIEKLLKISGLLSSNGYFW